MTMILLALLWGSFLANANQLATETATATEEPPNIELSLPDLLREKTAYQPKGSLNQIQKSRPPCLNLRNLPPLARSSQFNPAGEADTYRQFLIQTVECVIRMYPDVQSLRWMLSVVKETPFINGTEQSCGGNLKGSGAFVPRPYNHVVFCSSWPYLRSTIYGLGYTMHELVHVLQKRRPEILWQNNDRNINPNVNGRELLYECQADQIANQLLIDAWGYTNFLSSLSYYTQYPKECQALARQNVPQ